MLINHKIHSAVDGFITKIACEHIFMMTQITKYRLRESLSSLIFITSKKLTFDSDIVRFLNVCNSIVYSNYL